MTPIRRLLHLRRALRLLPKLARGLDALESLVPKLEALDPVLKSLSEIDRKVAEVKALESTVNKIISLDDSLARIESLGARREVVAPVVHRTNGNEERHGWNRLELLAKFANLSGKAKEIEEEWQKIQQDEHDEHFALQVLRGNNEGVYLYKKGIADGIKWCVKHFC